MNYFEELADENRQFVQNGVIYTLNEDGTSFTGGDQTFDATDPIVQQRFGAKIDQDVSINQLALDPLYADARTQALMEAQRAQTRGTGVALAGLYGGALIPQFIEGEYEGTLKERATPEFYKQKVKELDKDLQKEGAQLTRQVQKASGQIAQQLEKQQAAKGGVQSAAEATTPQRVATEQAISGLQEVSGYLGQARRAGLDKIDAKVEEALQGVYMLEQQRKKAIERGATNLAVAFMRLQSKSGVQADLTALQTLTNLGGDELTATQANEIYSQLYGPKAYGQRPTEERIKSVYKSVMGEDTEISEQLLKGLLEARPPGDSLFQPTNNVGEGLF